MPSTFWIETGTRLISTPAVIGFCGLILLVAVWALSRVVARTRFVREHVQRATRALDRIEEPNEFTTRFARIDETISAVALLSGDWRRFADGLLPPHRGVTMFRSPVDPSEVFRIEGVLGRAINLRLVQAVPSYLTGLGIFFTFLGLVAGLSVAAGGLTAASIDGRLAALEGLLSSAGLAFLTSMMGLFTSIVVSGLERRVFNRVAGDLNALNDRLRRLVPVVSAERIAAEQLREQEEQTLQLRKFNTDLAASVAEQLDSRMSERLSPVFEQLQAELKQLQMHQARVGEELLRDVGQQISEAMSGAAGKEAESLREAFKEVGGIVETFRQLTGETNALLGSFQSTVTASQRTLEDLAAAHEALRGTAEPIQKTAAEMATVTSSAETQAGRMGEAAERLERVGELLEVMKTSLVESWRDYETRFAGVDQALARSLQSIQEGMGAYSDKVGELNGALNAHLAKSLDGLSGVIGEFEEQIEALSDALNKDKGNG